MSSLLAQAVCLSEEMLQSARSEDWDSLALQEAQREIVLQRAAEQGERDHEAVGTLIRLNDELRDTVRRARDLVADEWQRANGRAQAIAAYLSA
ncbi:MULTISPECIES: flagellar protein FliT [Dyella]|uniref:Flagellar protein FliT n=2 Tax=Dyella TaxID=231454 RepID=A0A4R0YN27_9GAMM|nr:MULTISPECIES: flagellar protein FliT [Dyella]TBR37194.1 flagellar protein FliT [Dyella terrae]TCI07716.1 flagellar protein FliT [Dyella soli]